MYFIFVFIRCCNCGEELFRLMGSLNGPYRLYGCSNCGTKLELKLKSKPTITKLNRFKDNQYIKKYNKIVGICEEEPVVIANNSNSKYLNTVKLMGITGKFGCWFENSQFLDLIERDQIDIAELCKLCKISAVTGYKWRKKIIQVVNLTNR